MGDRGVRLGLGLDGVQGTFCLIIKITSPRLNPPYSAGFAEHSLLSDTERYHIIDDRDPPIHIALSTTNRRWVEEGLRDACSLHKRVSNRPWGGENGTKRLRVSLELRLYVIHRSNGVVFFLDLLHKLPLSRINLSIHGSFGLLILIVDGVSLCTVDEREFVSNTLEQFISAAAKLLDFFLQTDTCTLRLGQLFGSSGVDPSTHSVGRLDQLRPRRRTPVYGLGVVSDHAGQVVALEDG